MRLSSALMGFLSAMPSARPFPSPVATSKRSGARSASATKLKLTASERPDDSMASRSRATTRASGGSAGVSTALAGSVSGMAS